MQMKNIKKIKKSNKKNKAPTSIVPIGNITVLPIYYPVRFGEKFKVEGKITAVRISAYSIMYEISFWRGEEYKTQVLPSTEFIIPNKAPPVVAVGFNENALDVEKEESEKRETIPCKSKVE